MTWKENVTPEQKITQYILQFLGKSHPVFGGLSPCPFARKELVDKKIQYFNSDISPQGPSDNLIEAIRTFDADEDLSTFLAFDIQEQIDVEQAGKFAQVITDVLADIEILAIPLHPKDPFAISGIKTREGPFVMMLIQRRSFLDEAKQKLLRTSYYKNWDDKDQRIMQALSSICDQHNAFFPEVWWTDDVIKATQRGEPIPQAVFGSTIRDVSLDELHFWMHKWGRLHNWHPLCPTRKDKAKDLQQKANENHLILMTAMGVESSFAAILMPETDEKKLRL